MESRLVISFYVLVLFLVSSCNQDHAEAELDVRLKETISIFSKERDISYFIMPDSDDYDALPNQDPNNPITEAKVTLGKYLFFETGLAQNPKKESCFETYSCSSCHIPSKGFLPGRKQGIADGAEGFGNFGSDRFMMDDYLESDLDAQGNRPLTVMNVTYMTNTLWSGLFGANDLNVGSEDLWEGLAEVNHTGYAGLEAQNIEGFELHRLEINDHVLDDYDYRRWFTLAFHDRKKEDRYTRETASFAMGAYLRTILTNQAPFQDYLKGNNSAITESQKRGALLFFGKAGCINCHNSPSFSSMSFYALGTKDMHELGGLNTSAEDPRVLGRGMFTGLEEDMYNFKEPQLYNLKNYVSFFHGSSKSSIEEVVNYKLKAKSENDMVPDSAVALFPRTLTPIERWELIDFLTEALNDDNMDRYAPSSLPSGLCFPNNDPLSRKEIGCN